MVLKTIAKWVLCLLAMGMAGLLFWAFSKHNSKIDEIRHLSEINALTIYGDSFASINALDPAKRTALFFFHPECEYCQKELEGILINYSACRDVQWLFITLAPTDEVEAFLVDYPLLSIPNAYVLREDWPDTYERFAVKGPPALFIYDETGKLMKRHMGAVSIKTIVQELQ